MSERVRSGSGFVIIDDLLDPTSFSQVYGDMSQMEFKKTSNQTWSKVYHPTDGEPLETGAYVRNGLDGEENTSCPLRLVSNAVAKEVEKHGILGPHPQQRFFARGCIHPAGSGLSWHRDGDHTVGSFVYFAHRRWSAWWGGELMIAESPSARAFRKVLALAELRTVHATFTPEIMDELLLDQGQGTFIVPKPNRLVLMNQDVFHTVKPVLPAAGRDFRLSVSGFFLKT
jgi:hypothetical protein